MIINATFKYNFVFKLDKNPDFKQFPWNTKQEMKTSLECILLAVLGNIGDDRLEEIVERFHQAPDGYSIKEITASPAKNILDILTS